MNCKNHPEVAGTLTIDLPSIGVQAYMCEPCRAALISTVYKGKREAWERGPEDKMLGKDLYVMGQSGYYVCADLDQDQRIFK